MESLTKKEEEIMQVLWRLKKGVVHAILTELPEPKPKYTTVSTVVRILEEKGFVNHRSFGKTHEYFPVVSKMAYKRFSFKQMISSYFDNSYENVVSFMVNDREVSEEELAEMKQIIEENEKLRRGE